MRNQPYVALGRQVERLQRRLENLRQTSYRLSWLRFGVAIAALVAVAIAFFAAGPWIAAVVAIAGVVLFAASVYAHRRIEAGILRHEVWLRIKEGHLARARLDWEKVPRGFRHRPRPEHPFESDLNLVGSRSVLQLMDVAVSHEGSQRLRDWLTELEPQPEESLRRQRLVREMESLSLFRDKLALNATVAAGADRIWEASTLLDWLRAHGAGSSQLRWLVLFGAMAAANVILLIAWLLGWLPPVWALTLSLYLALFFLRSRDVGSAWDEALALNDALRQLQAVFGQLEAFTYRERPELRVLCAPFLDPAHRPSRYLARVTRVVAAMGVRGNPFVWLALNALVPWDYYFAYRLDQAKAALAERAPAWMDVWFELEALSGLANYACLNPGCAYPEIIATVDTVPQAVFEAEGLGHPLIPHGKRVRNDFSVEALGQVTVITGSNMAGKSVFLKTVGVNLALALAGGAVCAGALRTIPFRLYSSMAIADSVTDGISYFYAEVKRLKALLEALRDEDPVPLMYCIDEIFRGTNNRERLLGSRAYVRELAGKRGIGFIATHDLELARLADDVSQVKNYHFRDDVHDERMVFDYYLRLGPSPTTNALTIMELEGLPVPAAQT